MASYETFARCKHCRERIELINFSMGPEWRHWPNPYGNYNTNEKYRYCHGTAAEPDDGVTRDYSADPDALAWARGIIQDEIAWAREGLSKPMSDDARRFYKKYANMLEMRLVGGATCVVTPFDERNPQVRQTAKGGSNE